MSTPSEPDQFMPHRNRRGQAHRDCDADERISRVGYPTLLLGQP
jgi:hypothetical protein